MKQRRHKNYSKSTEFIGNIAYFTQISIAGVRKEMLLYLAKFYLIILNLLTRI